MRAGRAGRPAALGLLALATAGACAEGQVGRRTTGAPPKTGDASGLLEPAAGRPRDGDAPVILDSAFSQLGQPVGASWLAYGIAKMATYREHRPPKANTSADDFAIELVARRLQSETWAEVRADPKTPPNADLDRQLEISKAGFLPELVVAVHSSAGWTVPRETILGLRLEEFAKRFTGRFSRARFADYVPPGGTAGPPVPGGDFPDPASLPYGAASCGRARAAREAAWRRWGELEPLLGGAPVSASSPPDFGRQLIALKRDPAEAERGATWVSDRVGYLAQLEGFCAIEEKDWPRAEVMLRRAVALLPAEANPRLELSLVLVKLGRLDLALKETDKVLATDTDGCAIARAWRRRGYVLIDLGDLPAARQAYEKSLVVDPGNRLALSELETIARSTAAPNAGVVTPAAPNVVVTACRPQDLPGSAPSP
jgi:hypothetical protein